MVDRSAALLEQEESVWILELVLDQHPEFINDVWAIGIVYRHFRDGLLRLTTSHEMDRPFRKFLGPADPIYGSILNGMQDKRLASTLVSYWKIAHTMATQSRFWLEDAIAEIVERDPRWDRGRRTVYNRRMLGAGLFDTGRTLFDLGEEERETVLSNRLPWRVPVQRAAIEAIDRIVGDQELAERPGPREGWDWEGAVLQDREQLRHVAKSLIGPPPTHVRLSCNLLVVEPDRLDNRDHVWAFRFVNPTTFSSHAVRKQERVNLLRLFAYLAQEKPLRDPEQLHVSVAEVVPRAKQPVGTGYFSSLTYWNAERFWKHLGVPFEAIQVGIAAAGTILGEQLREGLQGLLPREAENRESPAPDPRPTRAGNERLSEAVLTPEHAREIAVRHCLQHPWDGLASGITSVIPWDEIFRRQAQEAGKTDDFWRSQWIVVFHSPPPGIRSSYIVAVDRRTGSVSYSGAADDLGWLVPC
jgi:hypothetical protein